MMELNAFGSQFADVGVGKLISLPVVLAAESGKSPTCTHVVQSLVNQSQVMFVVPLALLVNPGPVIEKFSGSSCRLCLNAL